MSLLVNMVGKWIIFYYSYDFHALDALLHRSYQYPRGPPKGNGPVGTLQSYIIESTYTKCKCVISHKRTGDLQSRLLERFTTSATNTRPEANRRYPLHRK